MSTSDMRKAMLANMEALADDILVIEAMAIEPAEAGAELSDRGAEELRAMVRRKQVQALERRSQLAALRVEYDALFRPAQ
ncbi:hypothetical protein AKJ13_27010 [Methylobacterium sp. ARG-1]|nr:hypothetical protein AKJ13_27010 [Methylobacterium sp. ARG-1]